jgi:hypothetical protein
VTVIHGDCIEVMRTLPADSIDSIVTDPPYGLGFMGKAWDALPPGLEWAEECLRVLKPGGHLLAFGGTRTWHRLAVAIEDAGFEIRDSIAWMYGTGMPKGKATLKPAFEPVVMARKPLIGTLADNEARHDTGALNIDACRIEATDDRKPVTGFKNKSLLNRTAQANDRPWMLAADPEASGAVQPHEGGRWPANVVLDESQAVKLGPARRFFEIPKDFECCEGMGHNFLYESKAPKKERPVVDGVAHPTVKPLALMRWLVKLVTPAGGTVLEPFAGSGATVEACILEGYNYIAIEREAEYLPLINHRIERAA